MDRTSPYHPPDIEGWKFVTNSCDMTAEAAERSYRRCITEILDKHGLQPRGNLQVRVESFTPDPEIRWAIYIR